MIKKKFRSFKDARAYVHTLKLKNKEEWRIYFKLRKKLEYIPSNPNRTYKNEGWKGWRDWLGTELVRKTIRSKFRPFKEAREYVQKLKLKNNREWIIYSKSGEKPEDIPTDPNSAYKKEWKGVGDWLGTGRIADKYKIFVPFKEAKEYVHTLKLKNIAEWYEYCKSGKKPEDIPANPDRTYKNKGWKGTGDWLGTGTIATFNMVFRPFKEAREYVHKLKLKSEMEWRIYRKSSKKPENIPTNPHTVYKNKGWKDWYDWLGTTKE